VPRQYGEHVGADFLLCPSGIGANGKRKATAAAICRIKGKFGSNFGIWDKYCRMDGSGRACLP
jgi:hypothetical protein